MKYRLIISPILLLVIPHLLIAQTKADDITGIWLIPGKESAKIEIYKAGEKYYGKIAWLKYPEENGKPKVDSNNPDKTKRGRQIIGLVILRGFKFDGSDEWEDGKIYDPESDKTYSGNLSLKNDKLNVRGYVGISLFGRTETWQRADN